MGIVRRTSNASAVLVIGLNVEHAVDVVGLGSLLVNAPDTLRHLNELAVSKWIFGLAMLVVGLALGDLVVRRSYQSRVAPGRQPLAWIEKRRRMVVLALSLTAMRRIVDVAFELAMLDAALTGDILRLPPLPTLDPLSPDIERTRTYLQAIGPIRNDRLPELRARARLLIEALDPSTAMRNERGALGRTLRRVLESRRT